MGRMQTAAMKMMVNQREAKRKEVLAAPEEYFKKIKLLFYTLNYAESCNDYAAPIYASLRRRVTQLLRKMLQRCRAVGNSTVSDLTGPTFEPQTSRDERVAAQSTACAELT